jgi:hypothetical protein
MKLTKSNRHGEAGNLILVALIVGGIAGVTLGSYLMMTNQQSTSIYRSQTWNSTMAVTEAGVEDGLQLVNLYAGSFVASDLFKWTNSAAGAGWDNPSPNLYHVKRYITNAVSSSTVTHYYEAWITNLNNAPVVYAEGTVPWTYLYAQNPALQPMFAQAGQSTGPSTAPTSITRRIYVQTHFDPLFVVAMAALGNIDLRGNNIATDSFDSSDPLFSNNGMYPTGNASRTRAHGDICTDMGLIDSLSLGNADIKGNVRTGPGTNTMSIGPNGSVGDRAWVEGGNNGIQPNHSTTDFNVVFPTVIPPSSLPLPVINTNLNGTNYITGSSTGDYLTMGTFPSGTTVISTPTNTVLNLRITGNVSLNGNDAIIIAPTGGQVNIFMYGSTFSLTGNGAINNQSGYANNFTLFGMPSCTTINFGGNAGFCGGVYAPNAAFSLGGGGNNAYDFVGSSVTRTVSMNGHFNFHFDENLAKVGPGRGYIPVAWREM